MLFVSSPFQNDNSIDVYFYDEAVGDLSRYMAILHLNQRFLVHEAIPFGNPSCGMQSPAMISFSQSHLEKGSRRWFVMA